MIVEQLPDRTIYTDPTYNSECQRDMEMAHAELMMHFGEGFPDGRLTAEPAEAPASYDYRAAIVKVKQLGRSLTEDELEAYRLS